jgi:hypothetical protein
MTPNLPSRALLQVELLASESVLGLTPARPSCLTLYARVLCLEMDISNAAMFRYQITGLIAFLITMKDNPSLLDGWIE